MRWINARTVVSIGNRMAERSAAYVLNAVLLMTFLGCTLVNAQTEGDHGYDYEGAYDDDAFDADDDSGHEPAFDVPIVNVTVVTGQTAVLPCSIDYLGKYKMAWLDSKSIPLTYEDRRVIDDFRFSVVRPYNKEWNLQIRDIRREDQGQYRCAINTNPVKNKLVMLHVKVPASIIDSSSSDDMTVQEGDTVVLVCNVTGVPRPEVTWSRRSGDGGGMTSDDGKKCSLQGTPWSGKEITGEMIVIRNISRYCDDAYECIASNGVPPAVSRLIKVTVEFKPEVTLPNLRQGQSRGRETILECIITANPQAAIMWKKEGRALAKSTKYLVEAYEEGDNVMILSLRIRDIEPSDYGDYECYAKNPLGDDSRTMLLYEFVETDAARSRATNHRRWTSPSPSSIVSQPPIDRPSQPTAAAGEEANDDDGHSRSLAAVLKKQFTGQGGAPMSPYGMTSRNDADEMTSSLFRKWILLLGFLVVTSTL